MKKFDESANFALLAAGSAIAVLSAIIVNLLIGGSEIGSTSNWIPSLAASGALVGILTSIVLSRASYRQSVQSARSAEEALAITRIRATLQAASKNKGHAVFDFESEISVDLHVVPGIDAPKSVISVSMFLARLEDDPSGTILTGPPGSGKSALLQQLALRILNKREHGNSGYVPLLLQCRSWNGDVSLPSWVKRETRSYFDTPTALTNEWLVSGNALLLLDGLDEIQEPLRRSFVTQLNRWFESATGGRAIVTCRTSTYLQHARVIKHCQVASLQPLSSEQVLRYLSEYLERAALWPGSGEIKPLIDLLTGLPSEDLRNPLALHLFRRSLKRASSENLEVDTSPEAKEVRAGDYLAKIGKHEAAVSTYLSVIRHTASDWAPAAGVRASLLLARAGDEVGAREILHGAIAAQLEKSLEPSVVPLEDQLSPDEKEVLNALTPERSYNSIQIGSMAGLPPSRCNQALRRLRERGLIRVVKDSKSNEPRFRRPSLDSSKT